MDPSFLGNSSLQNTIFSFREIAEHYYISKFNLNIRIHRDITGEMCLGWINFNFKGGTNNGGRSLPIQQSAHPILLWSIFEQ
jgi:hypothetical protein